MSASTRGVPTLPVPLLRDAVGRETARLSLRRAAAEVSISPNGLRNFLNGSAPRSATRVKLERWLAGRQRVDRKSTRLNSSHGYISYAVFCLKKKKKKQQHTRPTHPSPTLGTSSRLNDRSRPDG